MSTPTSNNQNEPTRPLPNMDPQQARTPGGLQRLTSPRIPSIQRQTMEESNDEDMNSLFARLNVLRREETEILLRIESLSGGRRSPLGTNVTTNALVQSPSARTPPTNITNTPPRTPRQENIFKPVRF